MESNRHPWNSEIEVCKFVGQFIRMANIKYVIESGVFEGETSKEILKALPASSHFVGIDIEDHRTAENIKQFNDATNRGIVTEFILGDSKKELQQFAGHNFDLVFIDSAHYFEHVFAEFKAAEKAIKKGGFIMFHDSIHIEDVTHVIEYAKSYGYNEIRIDTPEHRGLSIIQRIN